MKLIRKITKHTIKFFIIPVVILTFVLAGTGAAVVYFFPKDKVLSIITSSAENALKRKVSAKDIRYSLKGARLSDVTILNSLDPNDSALINIGRIDVGFNLLALIHNRFEITELSISGINLVISWDQKQWNLQALARDIFGKNDSTGGKEGGGGGLSTSIKEISFENAAVDIQSTPDYLTPLIGKYTLNCTLDLSDKKALSLQDFSINLPEERGAISGQALSISPLSRDFVISGSVSVSRLSLGWIYRWN
ncbi:MAG: hypothetical protein ACRCUT_15270, partial [Spirochaetota bacterium]